MGEVELEPEVRDLLEGLDDQRWAQAMFHLDLLKERGRRIPIPALPLLHLVPHMTAPGQAWLDA